MYEEGLLLLLCHTCWASLVELARRTKANYIALATAVTEAHTIIAHRSAVQAGRCAQTISLTQSAAFLPSAMYLSFTTRRIILFG